MNRETAVQFIGSGILQRLKDGSFVPRRKPKPDPMNMGERRDTVSPLAVTKRCIRYDPHVFLNRKPLVIQLAETLNNPDKKMLLIAGPQGCGKTSLARGLIEMMGGGPEQVLWFDVNAHTDMDEIILFLLQYLTLIGETLTQTDHQPEGETALPSDPFEKLETLLEEVRHVPLLIVLDNVEHIVNAQYQMASAPLKETLNFLLGFENIKMILAGERLPYADMSANAPVVQEWKLAGLDEATVLRLLEEGTTGTHARSVLIEFYRKTQGYPWLIKTLFYLDRRASQMIETLEAFNQRLDEYMALQRGEPPIDVIIRYIVEHLSPSERDMACVLACLRHPANFETVVSVARFCQPDLSLKTEENFRETLEQSILKPLMKRTFPPQEVLAHIRERHKPPSTFQPGYELYRQVKKVITNTMGAEERSRIHFLLQEFYLREKNKPQAERVYGAKTKTLIAEAKHHANVSRQRRPSALANPLSTATLISPYQYGSGVTPAANAKPEPATGLRVLPSEAAGSLVGSVAEPLLNIAELNLTEEEKRLLLEAPPFDETVYQQDPDFNPDPSESDDRAARALLTPVPSGDSLPEPAPDPEKAIEEPESEPEDEPDERLGSAEGDKAPWSEDAVSSAYNIVEEDPVERQLRQKLSISVTQGRKAETVMHLAALARHRASKGLDVAAEECLQKALALAEFAQPPVLAELYSQRGKLHKAHYRHTQAMDEFRRAFALYQTLEDAGTMTPEAYERRGELYQDVGDMEVFREHYAEATGAYGKAVADFSRSQQPQRAAETYFKLAQAYDAMAMPDESIAYFERSLALDRQAGNTGSCASALANIGSIWLEVGNIENALTALTQSLGYDQQYGNVEGQYHTLNQLAQAHQQHQNLPQAEACYQRALALAMEEANPTWKANIYLKLGNLHAEQNRWAEALAQFQLAKATAPIHELSAASRALLDEKIEEARHGSERTPS